jgi:hypothetical protein
VTPQAPAFDQLQISQHAALTGQAQPGFGSVRWEAEPPFFDAGHVRHVAVDPNRTGAAGAHSAAVNGSRNSIVQGRMCLHQNSAKVFACRAFNNLISKLDDWHLSVIEGSCPNILTILTKKRRELFTDI